MTFYNVRGPEDAVRFVQLVRVPWGVIGIELAWADFIVCVNSHDRHAIRGPKLVVATVFTVFPVYNEAFPAAVYCLLVSNQSLVIAGIRITRWCCTRRRWWNVIIVVVFRAVILPP